jgi:hypothetical protein
VWADGVCINQKNVHERNRQVRLMGDIYSTAQHTIIFLGLSSPQCDFVFQSIATGSQPPVQSEERLGTSSQEIPTRQFETIVEDEILSRPWFTRVWILQELVLSQDPWLQCGRSRVRWQMFCRTVLLSEHCSWRPDSVRVLTHMSERWIRAGRDRESHSEKLNEEAPGKDLLELVCARGGCSLSDPRDMIYAHLGLVGAETRNMVPVDYEKTVAQLYTSMTELYMQWIGIWDILMFAGVEPELRDPSLPSWVVDWSLSEPRWAGRYNTNYVMTQRSLGLHSLAVPHVLAVCGGSCGPIDSIIPASSWPTIHNSPDSSMSDLYPWHLEMELDDSMLQDILDWISKSDDNVLRARRSLVDFTMSMASVFLYQFINNKYGARASLSDTVLWYKVISAISQWPEISTTSGPLYREDNPDSRGSFIRLCLRNLVFLAAAYSGNECVAVLKSKRVLGRVSNVAQPGDFVANIYMSGRSDYNLFRPCGLELNHKEEELIRNDFEVRYPPESNDLPNIVGDYWNSFQVPFQNCRYVARTAKPSYTEPPWSSNEHTIFALH